VAPLSVDRNDFSPVDNTSTISGRHFVSYLQAGMTDYPHSSVKQEAELFF
jgi:hypothetical protein